jgi:hypothetical protein
VNETSSTALTTPALVKKCVRRPSTVRTASVNRPPRSQRTGRSCAPEGRSWRRRRTPAALIAEARGFSTSRSWSATRLMLTMVTSSATPGRS